MSIWLTRGRVQGRNKRFLMRLVLFSLVFSVSGLAILVAGGVWTAKAAPASHLVISEVFYDTPGPDSDEEWIEIYNPTGFSIDISNYKLGDEETRGGSEGMFAFPDGTVIAPRSKLTVALKTEGFTTLYGKDPDFEVVESRETVPNLSRYSAWGTGSTLALANTGDEVLLLNAADVVVDAVAYKSGSVNGVVPHPGVTTGHSLERFPADQDTDDCSLDFIDQDQPNPEDRIVTPENGRPVADPGGPYTAAEGDPITFDGSGSHDPDQDGLAYFWEFGDGATSAEQSPVHAYLQEGIYTVALRVGDGTNNSTTQATTAVVSDIGPEADFSVSPFGGASPLEVYFSDTSLSYDGIASRSWDFNGDGEIDSSATSATYTYQHPGIFVVSLTVREADGDEQVHSKMITVTEAAHAGEEGRWDYVFEEPHEVVHLRIDLDERLFALTMGGIQFAPRKAAKMTVRSRGGITVIKFEHSDSELRIKGLVIDDPRTFAVAILRDKKYRQTYLLGGGCGGDFRVSEARR